ncbi:TetR/AcrR family transcriptional regulator [Pseudalkalibacillus caeni]|uniref:TetR/AcrR family transcriptional regulator n=1 Tax=Exobacillus caeni TaxID=2574798 RepID=A0A5R9EZ52_9BACL|nr:TetR/AcrR family transcriptional regulator [Pseudalkalibacillus caeni]TLS36111.1 TetR/AcrR family transcriptional regulator [Pseudalkalibacillus caeni]
MSQPDMIKELLLAQDQDGKLSEKQVKILEAAVEIFSEKGYAATSTSEIAKKAGVAEGTIFRHYKTKKDLLMSIVTPTLTKVLAPFMARDFVKKVFENDHNSFEDFIRLLIKNRYEFAKKNLPIIKIFLQEIAFHEEIREQYKAIFNEQVKKKFFAIIEHFQEKGEITDLPPTTVIRLSITTVIGHLFTRFIVLPNQDWDDEAEIERTIEYIMKGLRKDER